MKKLTQKDLKNTYGGFALIATISSVFGAIYLIGGYLESKGASDAARHCRETCKQG